MTFSEIIDLWPSLSDFADDIGVTYGASKQMRRRNSIAPGYWDLLVKNAARRGIEGVSLDALSSAAAERRAA